MGRTDAGRVARTRPEGDGPGGSVVVVGLQRTGAAVVNHLAGRESVIVVEDRPGSDAGYAERAAAARRAGARVVEAPDEATAARLGARASLVVPSPGVPERHPLLAAALASGVPVRSEIELAWRVARAPIVAVTGTNGKTTVTSLIARALEASGRRAVAAGNVGLPLIEAVGGDPDDPGDPGPDVLVAEVSSFQLRFTDAFRPLVAVVLNVDADHLDWHGSLGAYREAKARIFANQRGDDLLVADLDDPVARSFLDRAPARTQGVSATGAPGADWTVAGGWLTGPEGARLVPVADLPGPAPHQVGNALAAAAAAIAAGADRDATAGVLRDGAGLHHRVELVGQAGGVSYYDDSKATNPHATVAAVEGFDRVVLVAGGRNKGLDLGVLRRLAPRLRAVVAIGEAGPEVLDAFDGTGVPAEAAASMAAAVAAAARRARPGDAVILSPACASFDWYPDYAARGRDFAAEVGRRAGAAACR